MSVSRLATVHRRFRKGDRTFSAVPIVAKAVAGPALIVVGVLTVLREIAFSGKLPDAHVDLVTFFLPKYCFLGSSLQTGTVPGWDPHAMLGAPFAADPLSGWMQAAPMLLYGLLPCSLATQWIVIVHPLLAGLGVYWFLRTEGTSRIAATVGGLALSMGTAAGVLVAALHFAGIVAWTSVLLAAAAQCFRSRTWTTRIVWLVVTAVAWGQLAATSLSQGTMIGTAALVIYGSFRLTAEVHESRLSARGAVALAILLIVALPAVNLAYLLPRLAYLPRTTLGAGYTELAQIQAALTGEELVNEPRVGWALEFVWPVKLALSRGVYLGSGLLLAWGALWSRQHRRLAIALALYGSLMYVLSLRVTAEAIASLAADLPLVDVYLHRPARMAYGALVALALLGGIGVDAWLRATTKRARILMLVPGVLLWSVFPLALNQTPSLKLMLAGSIVSLTLLVVSTRWRVVVVALPVVLATQLGFNALGGESIGPRLPDLNIGKGHQMRALGKPTIDASSFLKRTEIQRMILAGDARLLRLGGSGLRRFAKSEPRPFPLGVEEVQGYNSLQKLRYWIFVRTYGNGSKIYNKSFFQDPPVFVYDLLDVGWVTTNSPIGPPTGDWEPVVTHSRTTLYERKTSTDRASIVASWHVADGPDTALQLLSSEDASGSESIVLETDPGITPSGMNAGDARISFQWRDSQEARIEASTRTPAMLLVRNPYDRHWEAEVDGRASPLLRANYLLQAVPLPAGTHTVVLRYRDPWIARGVGGSLLSLTALGVAAAIAWFRRRSVGDRKRLP
ncbi:MAG: YfhO family protein [Actinomycetota bacterium]